MRKDFELVVRLISERHPTDRHSAISSFSGRSANLEWVTESLRKLSEKHFYGCFCDDVLCFCTLLNTFHWCGPEFCKISTFIFRPLNPMTSLPESSVERRVNQNLANFQLSYLRQMPLLQQTDDVTSCLNRHLPSCEPKFCELSGFSCHQMPPLNTMTSLPDIPDTRHECKQNFFELPSFRTKIFRTSFNFSVPVRCRHFTPWHHFRIHQTLPIDANQPTNYNWP